VDVPKRITGLSSVDFFDHPCTEGRRFHWREVAVFGFVESEARFGGLYSAFATRNGVRNARSVFFPKNAHVDKWILIPFYPHSNVNKIEKQFISNATVFDRILAVREGEIREFLVDSFLWQCAKECSRNYNNIN
jgi:hypothetical protein